MQACRADLLEIAVYRGDAKQGDEPVLWKLLRQAPCVQDHRHGLQGRIQGTAEQSGLLACCDHVCRIICEACCIFQRRLVGAPGLHPPQDALSKASSVREAAILKLSDAPGRPVPVFDVVMKPACSLSRIRKVVQCNRVAGGIAFQGDAEVHEGMLSPSIIH